MIQFEETPAPTPWWEPLGSVSDMLAAVGTVGAFIFGFALLGMQLRKQRRAAVEAFVTWHSLSVKHSTGNPITYTLTVRALNTGSTPIPVAVLQSPQGTPTYSLEFLNDQNGTTLAAIEPGDRIKRSYTFYEKPDLSQFVLRIADSKGVNWWRLLESNRYISSREWFRMSAAARKKSEAEPQEP